MEARAGEQAGAAAMDGAGVDAAEVAVEDGVGEATRVQSIHRRMSSEMKRFETIDKLETKRRALDSQVARRSSLSGSESRRADSEISRRGSTPSTGQGTVEPQRPERPTRPAERKVAFALTKPRVEVNERTSLDEPKKIGSLSRREILSDVYDGSDEEDDDDDGMIRIPTPETVQTHSRHDWEDPPVDSLNLPGSAHTGGDSLELDADGRDTEPAQENMEKWAKMSPQDRKCVQLAALWLEDAVSGVRRKHAHGTLWMERLEKSVLLGLFRTVVYCGVLVLGLTENVYQCLPSLGDPQQCSIGTFSNPSGKLISVQGHALGVLFSLGIAAELWFQLMYKKATTTPRRGNERPHRKMNAWRLILPSLVVVHIDVALSFVFLAIDLSSSFDVDKRRNLYCCILVLRGMITTYEWFRRNPLLAKRLAHSAKEMVGMTLIFLWTLVSFALLACVIFNPSVVDEPNLFIGLNQEDAATEEVQFLNVMWKVLALATVKNYVSLMLNAYRADFFYSLYFMAVIIVFVFLAAFMFAVVLARYGSRRVEDRQEEVYRQREALVFTFYYLLKVAGTSLTPPNSPKPNAKFKIDQTLEPLGGPDSPGSTIIGSHKRSKSVGATLDALRVPKGVHQDPSDGHHLHNSLDTGLETAVLEEHARPLMQDNRMPTTYPGLSVDSFASLRPMSPPQRENSAAGPAVTLQQRLNDKAMQFAESRNAGTIGIEELRLLLAEYSLIQTQSLTFKALQWRVGRLLGYNGAWVHLAPELMQVLASSETPDRIAEVEFLRLAEVMRLNERAVLQHFSRLKSLQSWNRERRVRSLPIFGAISLKAASIHSHPGLRLLSNVALVINAVVLIGLYQVSPGTDSVGHSWQYIALLSSLAELVLGITAYGFGGFFLTFPVDWLLLMNTLVTRCVFLAKWQFQNVTDCRYLIPSVLRFATLPFQLATGKLIFAVLVGVGWDILEIAAAMFTFGFTYAAIGYWAFGGKLFSENNLLLGSSYALRNFFPHSFNSLSRGMVVLFQFTFLNDWPATMSGLVAVSSNAAPLYFLFWFLVVVAVALNILTSAVTRPYIILRADRSKLSLACTRFGLGEEVVKTFLWKEADVIDLSSQVWNKRLNSVENAKTYLQDMNDDPGITYAAQKLWKLFAKPGQMLRRGSKVSLTASTQLTPNATAV